MSTVISKRCNADAARVCAASCLAEIPVRVRFVSRPVEERTERDGRVWRESFAITVQPGEQFTVHLHAGASSRDLLRAQEVIARARSIGIDYGDRAKARLWLRRERGDWIYCAWHLSEREHVDELRGCPDATCVEHWHRWCDGAQDDPCALEPIRPANWCDVYAYRFPGEQWFASTSFHGDPPEGLAGLRAIRDLANDYAWMQGECERLNAAVKGRAV